MVATTERLGTSPRLRDRTEYRLYFAAAFLVVLPVALLGRLLPRSLRPLGRTAPGVSVFDEAASAARSAVPWIFMG